MEEKNRELLNNKKSSLTKQLTLITTESTNYSFHNPTPWNSTYYYLTYICLDFLMPVYMFIPYV